jgi:hypothetical protein
MLVRLWALIDRTGHDAVASPPLFAKLGCAPRRGWRAERAEGSNWRAGLLSRHK